MLIEILCHGCGQLYQPSIEDLRCGPDWYRQCPACRTANVADENTE